MLKPALVGLFVALSLLPGLSAAQECLHGPNEPAAEKARRVAALRLAREINTAQLGFFGSKRRYGNLQEIESSMAASAETPWVWTKADGFELKLVVAADAYALALADRKDPCGMGYWSDAAGVIVEAYPVGSRWWDMARAPAKLTLER